MKIGDKLYKYEFKFLEYSVLDVIKHESTKTVFYEIECDSCTHGTKCKVLVTKDDNLGYRYVKMLNEDEYEKQYYWHNEGIYYSTKKECLTLAYKKSIADNAKKIEEYQKSITRLKEQTQKALDIIETL